MNTPLRGRIHTGQAITASAGIALIVVLAGCGGGGGSGNGPGSTKLDLVIGNSLPLSGSSKPLGESGKKASELALDRIKQAADSVGAAHSVRIVNEDQGADTDSAVDSARKLVDADGASCLTGPWSSAGVADVAREIAIPDRVLEISPVATGGESPISTTTTWSTAPRCPSRPKERHSRRRSSVVWAASTASR